MSITLNPFWLAMAAMQTDQMSRGNQQAVDAKTTALLSNLEQIIIAAQDPALGGPIGQDLHQLIEDVANKASAAQIQADQAKLQADSANWSNMQSRADAAVQQQNARTGQDGSDMSQVTQLLTAVLSVLSAVANMLASRY